MQTLSVVYAYHLRPLSINGLKSCFLHVYFICVLLFQNLQAIFIISEAKQLFTPFYVVSRAAYEHSPIGEVVLHSSPVDCPTIPYSFERHFLLLSAGCLPWPDLLGRAYRLFGATLVNGNSPTTRTWELSQIKPSSKRAKEGRGSPGGGKGLPQE